MPKPNEEDLSQLEKLLTRLEPKPSRLDRDALLYRAGQASLRGRWLWPLAALTASIVAACLAAVLVLRPAPEIRTVRVEVPVPTVTVEHERVEAPAASAPSAAPEPLSPTLSYWRLQQQALLFGAESLPRSPVAGEAPVHSGVTAGSRPSQANHSLLFPLGEP